MIIGVDYTAAAWQGAGIGRYTRELIRAVVGLDQGLRYTLFYAAGGLPTTSLYLADLRALCAANPNVRARPIPLTPRQLTILWQRLRLPLRAELLAGPIDILHAPDFVLPPTRARALLTVHDLTFLVRPECAEAGLRRYLSRAVPRALRRADMVLVDSRATAGDLARLLGVGGPRVRLVYPGVDPRFRPLPAAEAEPARAALGLPEQFLLFVGTLEPRKNLPRLIEGFALADLPAEVQLVIVGRKGWLYEEVFAMVGRLGLGARVRFLDFVDDARLPALYNLARAFVYPSLYEGFGLPALEAMACGAPVVTAAVSSLPEVVGDAAVLVDPLSVESIATGIRRALAQGPGLRAGGPPQASRFTWEAAARALLGCYQALGIG
ncbi:MAG: glycosyltransferase family 4 protein [Chloroflexales bacterium]|nr:glycosyltransferase family 4 protein [Chloroflexales bacterium]